MRQSALAFDQDIESMRAIARQKHIGFPVSIDLSPAWLRLRSPLYACSVVDSLAALPVGPLRFAFRVVARKTRPSSLRRHWCKYTDKWLRDTHEGKPALFQLEAAGDQFGGPASAVISVAHIRSHLSRTLSGRVPLVRGASRR